MTISPQEARDRIGNVVVAEFEIFRGTDTETLEVEPSRVVYATTANYERGFVASIVPLVVFHFNKRHPRLPPWDDIKQFTLHGEEKATFEIVEHRETEITGNLKCVWLASYECQFDNDQIG